MYEDAMSAWDLDEVIIVRDLRVHEQHVAGGMRLMDHGYGERICHFT